MNVYLAKRFEGIVVEVDKQLSRETKELVDPRVASMTKTTFLVPCGKGLKKRLGKAILACLED